jgi:hypothetical protein
MSPSGGRPELEPTKQALEKTRILIWRLEQLEKLASEAIDQIQPLLRHLTKETLSTK